jgi:hypothetical protein
MHRNEHDVLLPLHAFLSSNKAFNERAEETILVIDRRAYEELEAENARLILTLKKAYKKHVQDDPRIGWNELGDILMSTLCDSIGDDEFVKFCEQE